MKESKILEQHVSVDTQDIPVENTGVAVFDFEIKGSKGGEKKQHVPYESPDSLRSLSLAKILIALGEGEFQGTPTAQDIYLDDTPMADSNGNLNFPNVKWDYRSGSQDQDYIPGFPAVESGFNLNHELRANNPYIRAITNTQLSAVRLRFRWPTLITQESNGDVNGNAVNYEVDVSTDGGAYITVLSEGVNGKTTNGYERSRRIDLPSALTGWQIRVRRTTPDSTSSTSVNTMYVTGITEIIDAKLRYPNTALLYVEFDAEQFSNIPKISCRIRGRAWPVPTNYDPETRTYSGIWDGTFKQAWTDNPVWVGYGIMIHERFGLGKRIKPQNIDKWELYRISQYCDEMVSNGAGGLEPRFTCNMYIQSRAEAWTVLRDIAAIYRGMTYWSQSQMSCIADMPRDVDYVFSRSNVIDGKFVYSGSSERNVYTRAIIAYDDPSNMYNSDTTAVHDQALQRRYGDNLLEITAIGCTSQSEAQRRGKWALYTNSKNRIVNFQVGLDGNIPLPGYIIGIADPLLAGRPLGGRISSVISAQSIVLDRESSAKVGDLLIVNLPSGVAQSRTINSVSQNGKQVGVTTAFSELPQSQAQWNIDADDLAIQQFRVTKIVKDEPHLISIQAVYHDPNKYEFVDTGARREDRPITVIPPSVQAPVTNVQIISNSGVEQTMAVTTMTIQWEAPANAAYYDVEWKKDDKDWVTIRRVTTTSVDIQGVYSGKYIARVRAYNSMDIGSLWASSVLTDVVGKTGLPPLVQNLRTTSKVFGIQINWNFPTGALDTNYTEIQYNTTPNENGQELLLGTFAYPLDTYDQNGLGAGVRYYYRARLVDKTGNIGEWSNWVVGASSDQATEILDYLTGQITETELGQELLTEIGKIPEIEESLNDLQEQVDNITDALDYDPTRTYVTGEAVRVGNRLYQALQNVPVNTSPPNATYWIDVGSVVSGYGALSTQVNTNTANISNIDGRVTANSNSITSLGSRVTTAEGDITGQANALSGLTTRVTTVEGTVSSQSQSITNLNSSVGTAQTTANNAATAAQNASDLAGGKGKVIYGSSAPAVADRLAQNLWIDTTGNANTPKRWNGSAWVAVTDKVATDAASAAAAAQATANTKADASAVTALTTRVSNAEGTLNSQAQQITQLASSVGDAEASAQEALDTVADLNGDLSAMWSVKLQLNQNGQYVMAGIGAGIQNVDGQLQSNVIVRADQFAVINDQPGGAVTSPFTISGGQVFINQAFVADASITNAKIGNVIQSNNYVAGQTGWQLNKSGTFENNGSDGEGRMVQANTSIKIYKTGVTLPLIEIGKLS